VDIESGAIGPDITSFMRKSSLGLQGRSTEGIGKTIQRAKKRVERRLGRLGIGKGKKKVGGPEEVSGSCKKIINLKKRFIL
jgi:protein unc-80